MVPGVLCLAPVVSRRGVFVGGVALVGGVLPAVADDELTQSSLKPLYRIAKFAQNHRLDAPGTAPRVSSDFDQGTLSPFVGSYSDPNHPGGYRTVSLSDSKIGEFRVASLEGNDAKDEPLFRLPALVYADQMTVDFSAKGGPAALTGVWVGDGIKWPDGNKWPRTQ